MAAITRLKPKSKHASENGHARENGHAHSLPYIYICLLIFMTSEFMNVSDIFKLSGEMINRTQDPKNVN